MKATTLRDIARQDLHTAPKLDFVRTVAEVAAKEYSIRTTIEQIETDLDACIIKQMAYHNCYLMAELDSDILIMKECELKLFSIH